MRTKIFATSMGLAASVWMAGCQHLPLEKSASSSCGSNCAATARASKSSKESLAADLDQMPTDKTEKIQRVASRLKRPASPERTSEFSTTARSGAAKAPTAVAKDAQVASTCACNGKAGLAAASNSVVAPAIASLPVVPTSPPMTPGREILVPVSHPIPQAPAAPMIPHETAIQQPPIGVSYGPGVEVVAGGQTTTAPTMLPGAATVNNNVMTVRFGHANNYQIVVGQVYQFRRSWKLRYAALESEDKYGGSLSLVGDNLDHLKDGQMVRVEGVVIPSDDRASGARYQVNRVEVLEPDLK